jgi:hypothetical protein
MKKNKNEIVCYENYAHLIIYDKENNEKARIIIDLDDTKKIGQIHWHINKNKYVTNSKLKLYLHTYIMDKHIYNAHVVDHKNRNRLDCRKTNLRSATYKENGINKGKQSNNSSGYPGINWSKYHEKWRVRVKINGKEKFIGYYDNLEEAIAARQKAELEYYGEIIDRNLDMNTVFEPKETKHQFHPPNKKQ